MLVTLNVGTDMQWWASSNGSSWDIASAQTMGVISAENWHHIALARSGNSWKPFVDGVTGSGVVTSSASLFAGTDPLRIGSGGSTANMHQGQLDDIRITKGVARYTGNFTPPTEAFPDSGDGGGGGEPFVPRRSMKIWNYAR